MSSPHLTGSTYTVDGVNLFSLLYPVGCIYQSTKDTNPKDLFGIGEWKPIGAGRMLMGAGSFSFPAGSSGGKTDATIVNHSHGFTGTTVNTSLTGGHSHDKGTFRITGSYETGRFGNYDDGVSASGALYNYGRSGIGLGADYSNGTKGVWIGLDTDKSSNCWTGNTSENGDHYHTVSISGSIDSTGDSAANANLPPYLVVYMWERIK